MPIFDQLPCPALVTDRGGVVQAVNPELLALVGGTDNSWVTKPMDSMFPMAGRIFLQTHIWPMLLRKGRIHEIRLQILDSLGKQVPIVVNCQKNTLDSVERFTWVFFITTERARFEQELLEARQRAEAVSDKLAKSEKFIRTVADTMPSMISYWNTQLLCQFANRPYSEWFGRTPQEMFGLEMPSVLGDRLFALSLPHIQGALAGQAQEFERAIPRPDGSVECLLANYVPDVDSHGTIIGFFSMVTNITRRREAEAAIRLSASVFEATMEGIMVTDTDSVIVSVNPAFTALTGYTSEEIIGQNARIFKSGRHDAEFFSTMYRELHSAKLWKGEIWSKRKDGSVFLLRLCISSICDENGEVSRFVGVCADITEQWNKGQIVHHMALHDGLTQLPNRSLVMERLDHLIVMSAREPRQIALMFLDLDGFKLVNDTWGHETGDRVLKTVSARLLGLTRQTDTVARIGGDEFLILLDNPESRESIVKIASRVIEEINLPMSFEGTTAQVGTSIGIALYAKEAMSPQDLLKKADEAMYVAKAAGKNTYRFSGELA